MSAPAIATPAPSSPADIIRWQQEQISKGEYDLMGRVWLIVLEAAKGAAVPAPGVTSSLGVRLEFYGFGQQGQPLKPRIAQSRDKQTLLLLDPIARQDGSAGLPDIPDPSWTPGAPDPSQICWDPSDPKNKGKKAPAIWSPRAPMIPQNLGDRARGQLRGTRFLVFGPVAQVLVHPEGLPTGWILECGGDLRSGQSMELLIDQDTGQAFFFGGRFQIRRIE